MGDAVSACVKINTLDGTGAMLSEPLSLTATIDRRANVAICPVARDFATEIGRGKTVAGGAVVHEKSSQVYLRTHRPSNDSTIPPG
jgi:hypothetical protein